MNRRQFHKTLAVAPFALPILNAQENHHAPGHYRAEWSSIDRHKVPDWYAGAKLGIFIHWGLYSVPAWAPTTGEFGTIPRDQWFTRNPYAEWYLNSLRITGSPTYEHHIKTYGKNFDYYQFATDFNEGSAKWNPDDWAKLFRRTGARYVVLTTKHHDGFRLWPSNVPHPNRPPPAITARRAIAGARPTAVRSAGRKMGHYYSGGLDWTFTSEPIRTGPDLMARVPQTAEYARYADAHFNELIDRYQPAVLWNDISYPKLGRIPEIFAHYYNTVPDGVIDNRFGVEFADFTTPEYAKYDKITEKKWEACRGLGFSFGYNRIEGPEQVIAPDKLIELLVDIVSKNGNLLLNIGPKHDGTISDIQLDRLNKLSAWMETNGEGIHDTTPWVRSSASDAGAPEVRFTRKAGSVYAFLFERPSSNTFTIPDVMAQPDTTVRVLGAASDCEWKQNGRNLEVTSREPLRGTYALGVRLSPEPWQIVRD